MRSIFKAIICVLSSVGLVACATPYESTGMAEALLTGGINSYWADKNILKVESAGNGFSSNQRMTDFAFLKAAEKALEAEFSYFVLSNSQDTTKSGTITTYAPEMTMISASGIATTTGGARTIPYSSPGRSATFVMFEGVPNGFRPSQYFVAVDVYNELGAKYMKDFTPIIKSDPKD